MGAVYCCIFSFDDSFILSGATDRTVKSWNVENQTCTTTLSGRKGHTKPVIFYLAKYFFRWDKFQIYLIFL